MNYYIAQGNEQRGPFTAEQLQAGGLRADTLVWREGMAQWQPAQSVPELQPLVMVAPVSYAAPLAYTSAPPFDSSVGSKKILAGILGIVLGGFGIHKFVLGFVWPGLIVLLATVLTCGMAGILTHIIGIIEGIVYLTRTDEEFYRTYIVERRQWF